MTSTVEHKRTLIEKLVASQEAVRQKGKEAVQEAQTLQDKLKLIIDKTKELQVQVMVSTNASNFIFSIN